MRFSCFQLSHVIHLLPTWATKSTLLYPDPCGPTVSNLSHVIQLFPTWASWSSCSLPEPRGPSCFLPELRQSAVWCSCFLPKPLGPGASLPEPGGPPFSYLSHVAQKCPDWARWSSCFLPEPHDPAGGGDGGSRTSGSNTVHWPTGSREVCHSKSMLPGLSNNSWKNREKVNTVSFLQQERTVS